MPSTLEANLRINVYKSLCALSDVFYLKPAASIVASAEPMEVH